MTLSFLLLQEITEGKIKGKATEGRKRLYILSDLTSLRWRFGLAVTALRTAMKLPYAGPG